MDKSVKIVLSGAGFFLGGEAVNSSSYSIRQHSMYIDIKLITKMKRVNCSQNPPREAKA